MSDIPDEIIRDLADAHPIEHGDDMYHWCLLCQANLPVHVADHEPDCLWRRAVEWVAANPAEAKP